MSIKNPLFKKSFTLLEILIGVIIISTVISIGFSAYRTQIRQSYIAHAEGVLHQIRASILRYIIDNENFPTGWNDLDIENPSDANWNYTFSGNVNNFTITAVKLTNPYQNLRVRIDKAGNIVIH